MSLVTPSQSNPNDTIEAADINTPVNQLAAVINGNIETVNIADASITAAKIAAGVLNSGALTTPYKFSAYRTGALTLNASGSTKIPFDHEDYDTGSNFDTVTNIGRFTAPVAGFYNFSAQIAVLAGTNFVINAGVYVNGTLSKTGNQISTSSANASVGVTVLGLQLSANDYVEIYGFNGLASSVTVNVGQATVWFMGSLASV